MAQLDRAELLAVLAKLADADDSVAAEAGRSAVTLITEANLDWSDIILPADALTALADDTEQTDTVGDIGATVARAGNNTEALALIEQLLKRKTLYEGTRDELQAYKDDIANGEFENSDLAYLNALQARIMTGGGKSQ